MTYCILDLETSIYKSYKRKANPFDPRNKIVLYGIKVANSLPLTEPTIKWSLLENVTHIIGHNLKFDLQYLWLEPTFRAWIKNGGKIWDTQVVEYILTDQEHKYPSLDNCSKKYGGTLKDSYIQECWEQGIQTEDIDQDKLKEYLKHDLLNTELLFQNQLREVRERDLMPLVQSQMDDLLCLTEMERNGLKTNMNFCNLEIQRLNASRPSINTHLPSALVGVFNYESNKHMSAYLFGGNIQWKTLKEQKIRKTGKSIGEPYNTYTTYTHEFPKLTEPKLEWKTKHKTVYKVDEVVLSKIAKKSAKLKDFCKAVLDNREIDKQINTYYLPIIELTHRHDGILHFELNQVSTNTGRLSSKNPNCQNWPKESTALVKKACESRLGTLISIDMSQLEVVVQALLSNDVNMLEDIRKGVDFHCKRLAYIVKKPYDEVYKLCKIDKDPYWEQLRSMTKAFSFQRSYGAGADKIASSTGLSRDEALALIEAEIRLYPSVEAFNRGNCDLVIKGSKPTDKRSENGLPLKRGTYTSASGRRYHFYEQESLPSMQAKGMLTSLK